MSGAFNNIANVARIAIATKPLTNTNTIQTSRSGKRATRLGMRAVGFSFRLAIGSVTECAFWWQPEVREQSCPAPDFGSSSYERHAMIRGRRAAAPAHNEHPRHATLRRRVWQLELSENFELVRRQILVSHDLSLARA